jgi:hypothetical protein
VKTILTPLHVLLGKCQEIDREIILEVLPDLFPAIEEHNSELAKSIMFEVVDLPRNTPGNELEYKVSLVRWDHLCLVQGFLPLLYSVRSVLDPWHRCCFVNR